MIVVKFGGHAMADENGNFADAILFGISSGEKIVVVHGGGPQIDKALAVAGIESQFIGGFRYTSPEIFTIVERVLTQEVGSQVAHTLVRSGVKAKAISGRALPTFISRKKMALIDGTSADLGQVGEVVSVNTAQIQSLLEDGYVPVISPISADEAGDGGLNLNADLAAAALAGALDASVLIIMTDVAGIYRSWPNKDSLIDVICAAELESIKSIFTEGMAPKVQGALNAIAQGARAVRIIDGRDPASFSAALAGHGGTLVVA